MRQAHTNGNPNHSYRTQADAFLSIPSQHNLNSQISTLKF